MRRIEVSRLLSALCSVAFSSQFSLFSFGNTFNPFNPSNSSHHSNNNHRLKSAVSQIASAIVPRRLLPRLTFLESHRLYCSVALLLCCSVAQLLCCSIALLLCCSSLFNLISYILIQNCLLAFDYIEVIF